MAKDKPVVPIGAHAGRALADMVARIVVQTRAHTAVAETEHKRRMVEGMMDDWEGEIGKAAAELFAPLRAIVNLPPGIQLLMDRAAKPVNQTDFLLNLMVAIAGSFGALLSMGPIFYRNLVQELQTKHANIPLSPADAADATVRLGFTIDEAYSHAAKAGIDPDAFYWMAQLVGEPPPLDEMRTLLVQGRIGEDEFGKIFRYSRVRDEWMDSYLSAHYKPMSAADAVEGYVKGQLDHATALQKFSVAGGMPDEFDLAVAIAGNPIGVEQAANLYNRHLISDAEFTAVIRHSRINPAFEGMAKLTRFHFLTAFQIERMLTQGTITAEQAASWLAEDGYPQEQIAGLVAGAKTTKAVKAKTVSLSVVVDSYEAGTINRATAIARLQDLGYDAAEAEVELSAYDARRILALTNQAVTALRKAYMLDHITRTDASNKLDALGIHSAVRDHYLTLWDIEVKAEAKSLTMAQVGNLLKKGIISLDYAMARWETMGYSREDAELLSYEYGAALPHPGRPVR